tara:strand:+ start:68 stop:544 length:477 start_codon:yes stop_codon:yes gene_type:complete
MEIANIAFIIAVGTVFALIFQIWFQKRQLKQTENNQYDETLRKSMRDLYEVYRTDFEVKTKAECELFATRILDILAVLAHLNNEEKLPDPILEFVKFDLEIAKGIMKWFDKEGLGKKYNPSSSAKIWSNLTKYFKKHKTKTCKEDALPDCIKNYKDLK